MWLVLAIKEHKELFKNSSTGLISEVSEQPGQEGEYRQEDSDLLLTQNPLFINATIHFSKIYFRVKVNSCSFGDMKDK